MGQGSGPGPFKLKKEKYNMANNLDIYGLIWDESEVISGVLRKMYLILCDGYHCAAMLLDKLRAVEASARERADYPFSKPIDLSNTVPEYDPYLCVSIYALYHGFLGLFDIDEVENAFHYLFSKDYIYGQFADDNEDAPLNQRLMNIACNANTVQSDWDAYVATLPRAKRQGGIEGTAIEQRPDIKLTEEERQAQERVKLIEQERKKVNLQNKRAMKVRLLGNLTLEQWIKTLDHFEWKCAYCLDAKYTIFEHFVPLVHGKGTSQDNCVPACPRCNGIKQAWNPLAAWGPGLSAIKDGIERVKNYLETCKLDEMVGADYRREQ